MVRQARNSELGSNSRDTVTLNQMATVLHMASQAPSPCQPWVSAPIQFRGSLPALTFTVCVICFHSFAEITCSPTATQSIPTFSFHFFFLPNLFNKRGLSYTPLSTPGFPAHSQGALLLKYCLRICI